MCFYVDVARLTSFTSSCSILVFELILFFAGVMK
jgi:hypothetical protein